MSNDPLNRLIKDSLIKTSDEFMDQLMDQLEKDQVRQFRLRLYVLVAVVFVSLLGVVAYLLVYGARLAAFGVTVELPTFGLMISVGLIGLLVNTHLVRLLRLTYLIDQKL